MPQAYVKKLAEKHGLSLSEAEAKWSKAKKAAEKNGHTDDYGYVTSIFKKMMHEASLVQILVAATIKDTAKLFESPRKRTLAEAVDSICMTTPVVIRVLELAREEIPDDAQLHIFVEKLMAEAHGDKTLDMDAYERAYSAYVKDCKTIGLPIKLGDNDD